MCFYFTGALAECFSVQPDLAIFQIEKILYIFLIFMDCAIQRIKQHQNRHALFVWKTGFSPAVYVYPRCLIVNKNPQGTVMIDAFALDSGRKLIARSLLSFPHVVFNVKIDEMNHYFGISRVKLRAHAFS